MQCSLLCRRLFLSDLLKRDFGNAHPTSSLRITGELQIDNTIPQIRNGTVLFRNHHIYGTLLPFLRQFERSHDIIMFPDMRTKLSPYLQLGTDCVLLFIRFCPETALIFMTGTNRQHPGAQSAGLHLPGHKGYLQISGTGKKIRIRHRTPAILHGLPGISPERRHRIPRFKIAIGKKIIGKILICKRNDLQIAQLKFC